MKLLPPSSRQEYHPIHRKLSFGPSPDKQWSVMKSHPMIPMIGLLMFGVIMGSGICIIKVLECRHEEALKGEALSLAKDTGRWFSDQLDRAMLPLFSLSQFVNELDEFQSLPAKIGEANQPGSAPLIPSSTPGAPPTHRNVSGICDDPVVANRFKEIAATCSSLSLRLFRARKKTTGVVTIGCPRLSRAVEGATGEGANLASCLHAR